MADIQIYGTLASGLDSGKLARSANIYDEYFGKYQSELNRELERIGDFITDIELSEDVMNLSTTSSSDEIITTFGTINDYKVIVDRLINSKGVYAGFRVTGGKIPVIISASKPDGAYNISLQWVYENIENTLSFSSTDATTIACTESKQENFLGWRIDGLFQLLGLGGVDRNKYRKGEVIGTISKEKVEVWKSYFQTNSRVYINSNRSSLGKDCYNLCTDAYRLFISRQTDLYAITTVISDNYRTEEYSFGFKDNADDSTLLDVYLRVQRPNIFEIDGISYTKTDMTEQIIISADFNGLEVEWGSMVTDPGVVIFKRFWQGYDHIATTYRNGSHDNVCTFMVVGADSDTNHIYSFEIGLQPDGGGQTDIVITPQRLDIDGLTINGQQLLGNPVLGGSDIKVTGYSKSIGTDLDLVATDTINSAFGKLEKRLDDTVAEEDSRLDKLETLSGSIITKPYTASYSTDKQKITLSAEKSVKNASGSWGAPVDEILVVETPYIPTENIVNDLITGGATKVLSAEQGVALKNIIDNLIGFEVKVVASLPATGALGIIYLVAAGEGSGNDVYDEYVWVSDGSKYELIGNTRTDLSGYLSKTNTVAYTPTADYHPATKKYTDSTWDWYEGN